MVGATKTIITKMGRLKLYPTTSTAVVANNKCSILSNKQSFNKYLCCFVMIMMCVLVPAEARKMNSGKIMQNTEAATTSISSKEQSTTCSPNQFRCNNGQCIPSNWKCDTKIDCDDSSDEPNDCIKMKPCNEGQFQCKITQKCIPNDWMCDGDYDCGIGGSTDKSDEDPTKCHTAKKCLPNQSECEGGLCIDTVKFCDAKIDCINDEVFHVCYAPNASAKCAELKCSYNCKITPAGPKCYCPIGQEPNGTQCQDFNECKIESTCDQICTNTQNSFECKCVSGYTKSNNRCFGVNVPTDEPSSLLFITQSDIQRTSITGDPWNSTSTYKVNNPITLEMWHRNRTVCVINGSSAVETVDFRCHNVDDLSISWKMPQPEIFSALTSVDEMRLDWISGNWYFLNTDFGLIFVCNAEMQHCSIIVESFVHKPKSMVLDPTKGFIFFTKWEQASLERSHMDGTNRTTLVTKKIIYPFGLTLDLANEHIYWVDIYMDFVERVDYNGQNRWSMVKRPEYYYHLKSLYSIAYFENTIFVASNSNNGPRPNVIINFDKFNPIARRIVQNVTRPRNLLVFHRQRQPEIPHPCRTNNGGCDHLCLPSWKNNIVVAQCMCSGGYRLQAKNRCVLIRHSSFLIYAKQKPAMIKGIAMTKKLLPGGGNQEAIVPILNVKWPLHLDYNVKEQLIYFGQNNVRTKEFVVESQRIDGTERKIVAKSLDECQGIAYDWMGNNMFWASATMIKAISLTNSSIQKTLIHTKNTGSIVLDPQSGLMYWSIWSTPSENGSIVYAWMDGTHKDILVGGNKNRMMQWPSSLTIDYMEKKLYWCDPRTSLIERIGLDGQDREILLMNGAGKEFFPYSIAYYNGYIFWTDDVIANISRIHINSTGEIVDPKLVETLAIEKETVTDIKVFDNLTQTGTNDCRNKSCPGLLLITPEGCVCACGNGMILNASGTMCMLKVNYTQSECPPGNPQCKTTANVCDTDPTNDACKRDTNCADGFRCDGDRCIDKLDLCDGIAHCIDATDEHTDECKSVVCSSNQFQCNETKQCIPKTWVCDNHFDCPDKSDEMGDCGDCAEFLCDNKACVQYSQLCDGVDNCGDNSDENQCTHQCREGEEFCHPKGCISTIEQFCDGIVDCFDAHDEEDCHAINNRTDNIKVNLNVDCFANDFKCHNGIECVSMKVICDGINDCFDKSDELNCTTISPRPAYNETDDCVHPDRLCRPTGHCIRVEQLCDGTNDCSDGTDEGYRCSEKICDHNSECSHYCHNSPEGFVCSCPLHLFLNPEGLECNSEHACSHWGTCSQICNQVGKRHKCKCNDDFTLQFDQFSCKSNFDDSPYVIFSNRQEIKGLDLKTLAVKNFYASLRNTIALDFLYTDDAVTIFWTDVNDDKIYRGSLIGDAIRNVEDVVQSGLSTAEGLAVDWIALNIYWVDSQLDQIEVARINGSFRRTLVAGEISSPRAIALDPREGLLFWTDWDLVAPRIERCSMAGEYRKTIVQVDRVQGAWPNGITLDYTIKRVYWIDARSDSIHTTNYDGGDHHLVIRDQETLSHPFSISVYENHVYWTDWRTNSVIRANKWNGSDISILQKTLTQPFGIQILHSSRQPRDGVNPCSNNNGGCSHLCLLSVNKTYKCECPHVMRLDGNNRTCVPNEQVLLFIMETDRTEIRGVDILQPNHYAIPTISQPHVIGPNVIDFVIDEGRLYWPDVTPSEIRTAGLSNGLINTILDTGLENLSGFAVDWISSIMYISTESNSNSIILASNLKGELVTEIYKDLLNVLSIVVDPAKGKMYWSHKKDITKTYLIEMSSLDGSNREILINCTHPAESLTIDYDLNRLYFIYGSVGAINYVDLTKKELHELVRESVYPITSLTVYKDNIYFAESQHNTIRKCDKSECHENSILRNTTAAVKFLRMYHPNAQTGTNACEKSKNICQHLCLATSAVSFVCKCAIGYTVDPTDFKKCIGEKEFLLYSLGHELKGLRSNESLPLGEQTQVLGPIPRISLASKIDFHFAKDLIFWADNDKGTVTSIKRDGTNRKVLFSQFEQLETTSSDLLSGIAVDWVADNIYIADERRNIIEVTRLNGSSRYVVVTNVEKPTLLAVDPVHGLLFYAGDKRIGHTNLDGTQLFILANQTAPITSLVLDIANQVVYWSESTPDTIMKVDYDGNSKMVMLNHSLENPVGLAIDSISKKIYWADNAHLTGSIKVAPLNNLSDFTVLTSNEGTSLKDIKIFSQKIQDGTNICATNNGGCQELCLFNGTDPVCACSHGRISKDGKTCEDYDMFLIYSRVTSIDSIHLTDHTNLNGPIPRIQNVTALKNTIGLSYDYARSRIFYSDVHFSTINMVYFNGTNHKTIVSQQLSVEGLAYEALTDQLFWTTNSDSSIRAIDFKLIGTDPVNNTKLVRQVIKLNRHDKPRGIGIEPCLSMVYWTNWNSNAASIQRAYISGYGMESIITTEIRMPNALTIDYDNHKIYWADARLDKIERADYDGRNRVVLTHSIPIHPFAMAVYGDMLFWTDWVLNAVLRANKYSGADVVWLRKEIGRPMGIAAVQNTTKDCAASQCVMNGGCEDHCSIVNGQVKCECTQGKLANDGRTCLQAGGCNPGEFLCKSLECIPFQLTCDTIKHCMDGSDEHIEYCNVRTCPENFIQCNNRRCIPTNQTCSDGSDVPTECSDDHFKCSTGQCIELKDRCDKEPDCPDASDELNCPGMENICDTTRKLLKCENTTACYMPSWRCDGDNDCWDMSDEMNCGNKTCSSEQFACSNGQCISLQWRCDNEPDCDGGEDEMNCFYTTVSCKAYQFTCGDGTCIPDTFQCDSAADCVDGSDEGEHCGSTDCGDDKFRCSTSGRCIPQKWKCDGDNDCSDGEDERDCETSWSPANVCPDDQFACLNRQCIDIQFFCDGQRECTDGTDEYDGCDPSIMVLPKCDQESEFECDNRKCIPQKDMCNLNDDCGDNSDEDPVRCANSTLICSSRKFHRCTNGVCILRRQLCDGENDCGDFSDEESCNINECAQGALCAHTCIDQPVGYECTCYKGYRVSHKDRHLCEDIDECLNRPCSQTCTNTRGSYHCSCVDGYELKDRTICKSIADVGVKFIFTNRYYIREVDATGKNSVLVHNLSNAVALDYDYDTKCYYWSDVTSVISKIQRWCPEQNASIDLHHTMLKNPDGLSVDWVAKNLYWCDKGLDTIEVSRLDGKYRKILIKENLQEPRAIALNPFEKYIYWTDWGDHPHIGKAGMDGSNPTIIVEDDLGWPNALTISFETKELYWGDAREDYIAVCDLNGKNRKIIVSRTKNPTLNLHHIFAIAVWEDNVYWTDWETKAIETCHKNNGDNCTTLLTTIHRPMDIRVFHPYRQIQPATNPCRNSPCSTLCLLSPVAPYYKCACPNNFYLDTDNKTCIANCTAAQFICATTFKCIPFYWRCDGNDDCGDRSDEPANCPPFVCNPGQYQCSNSKCISPNLICDATDNCGDRSDEIDCEKFACQPSQFKCSATNNQSAFCIDDWKTCNGRNDCPNGDDEKNCTQRTCPPQKFRCDNGRCVPKVWVCDEDTDCEDGSDEKNCEKKNCTNKEFQCKSGRCIPLSWVCDGEDDCPNKEDESPECRAPNGNNTCQPTYFRCHSGKCIPGRWECDYEPDCNDNSDEHAGCVMRNCSISEFRCLDGHCIPGMQKCDGEFNCNDMSDELPCIEKECSVDEFKCPNHNVCINKKFICDGDNDCADGADERNCTCSSDYHQCANGRCILNRWRCDGWNDCIDYSDETVELCSTIPCGPHAYRCKNKRCAPKSSICDGVDDCGDNSDESDCSTHHKCNPNTEFQCERDMFCISKQFRCDGESTCLDDSDELNCPSPCGFGTCSQICLEKKTKHHNCVCANGFVKAIHKNNSCEATGREAVLLISSESEIRFMLPQKHHGSSIYGFVPISSLKIDVFDMYIDKNSVILFWIDSHYNNVQKLTMKTFNLKSKRMTRSADEAEVIISHLAEPRGLAVDWITGRLYLIDVRAGTIVSTNFNGTEFVTVTTTGPQPLDIVVDPKSKVIIWSTLEEGILSASLDGSNKQALVQGGVEWPTSLTIDYPSQRLYWVDQRKWTVETCLLTGKDRHIVKKFRNATMSPHNIDVFEDYLYITLYNQSIIKLHKFGTDNGTILHDTFHRSSDIMIMHPLKQDSNLSNPCQSNPCHMDSICLLSSSDPSGRVCKCADDMVSVRDDKLGITCKSKSNVPNLCQLKCNRGTCKFVNNQPKCICPKDHEGEYCEKYRCSGYCRNKGVCHVDTSKTGDENQLPPLKCRCLPQWTGDKCEIPASICKEHCHNGATCKVDQNGESCVCPTGYNGRHCEICDDLQCENSGVCTKSGDKSSCDCPSGYKGRKCEESICGGYCNGNGDCTIRWGVPQCDCYSGFWGKQCQSDSCAQFCENGGVCVNEGGQMKCRCENNYTGDRCQIPICSDPSCDDKKVNPCDSLICENRGVCQVIQNVAVCNCTGSYNGPYCQDYVQPNNMCVDYCKNDGICQLDVTSTTPSCLCVGDWIGPTCSSPPACIESCGECRPDSSLNECLCDDGGVSPCIRESLDSLEPTDRGEVLTVLLVIMMILVALIAVFGGAIYYLRKRRIGQPFSHARLTDNVEITNPMYLGEADEVPSFIHEEDKSHFANPVYESMYAGSSEPVLACGSSSSCGPDEKKGLLQHNQDESNAQDLL